MKLTEQLKQWLHENMELPENTDDAAYKKAAADALVSEKLTHDKFIELQRDPDADRGNALSKQLAALMETVAKSQEVTTKAIGDMVSAMQQPKPAMATSKVTPEMVVGKGESDVDEPRIRHKAAHEQYSTTKGSRYFPVKDNRNRGVPFPNERMFEGGTQGRRYIDEQSELDRAVCGAFAKHMIFGPMIARGQTKFKSRITDHDRELFRYAVENMPWGGEIDLPGRGTVPVDNRRLDEFERKQVLDDGGASGGLEVVPIVFDDSIITTPLLHSEFYPRVNVVNIARGRRIEGAKVANPTWTWAATEATAVTLETTTSFVSAFDTNIMTVTGSITMGRDFLSDSPVAFGDIVTTNAGQGLLNTLDDVIVGGNGTTQPDGVVGTGTNIVAFGGAWSLANMEALYFEVGKEYTRGDKNRICFGANHTSYQRIRAIATGVTGDTRLVFGMDIGDYMLFGHPFLISDSYGIAQASFTNLARYRMYRRLGMTVEMTTEGQTLMLSDLALLVFRARFGGQLEDFEASAYTTTGQTP